MKGLALFFGAVLLLQLSTRGEANECCRPKPGFSHGQVTLNCGDCKPGTPYCGVGRCNIWGCNCDGGCRKGTCGGLFSPTQIHDMIDTDKDGKLSMAEAREYLQNSGVHFEEGQGHIQQLATQAADTGFLPSDIIAGDELKYDRCEAHPFINAPENNEH